jgi:hypothetical protein
MLMSWDEATAYYSKVTDKLGMEIDPGILDTVVVFNILGLTTRASCEGHIGWGLPFPWIDLEPEEPIRSIAYQHLTKFYQSRPIIFDRMLVLYNYRLRSHGAIMLANRSEEEKRERLPIYQAEMAAFTAYLRGLIE